MARGTPTLMKGETVGGLALWGHIGRVQSLAPHLAPRTCDSAFLCLGFPNTEGIIMTVAQNNQEVFLSFPDSSVPASQGEAIGSHSHHVPAAPGSPQQGLALMTKAVTKDLEGHASHNKLVSPKIWKTKTTKHGSAPRA